METVLSWWGSNPLTLTLPQRGEGIVRASGKHPLHKTGVSPLSIDDNLTIPGLRLSNMKSGFDILSVAFIQLSYC